MSLLSTIYSKLGKINKTELGLFLKAVCWTGIARILILFVPLRRFSFLLGTHMKETPNISSAENLDLLKKVALAIIRTSRFVPWRCLCYEQAIAAKMILRKYGLETTMYYGVAKDQDKKLIAHAWVRCGNYIVTGGRGMNIFTVVGTFA